MPGRRAGAEGSSYPQASKKPLMMMRMMVKAVEELAAGSVVLVEEPLATVPLAHNAASLCSACHLPLPLDALPLLPARRFISQG